MSLRDLLGYYELAVFLWGCFSDLGLDSRLIHSVLGLLGHLRLFRDLLGKSLVVGECFGQGTL